MSCTRIAAPSTVGTCSGGLCFEASGRVVFATRLGLAPFSFPRRSEPKLSAVGLAELGKLLATGNENENGLAHPHGHHRRVVERLAAAAERADRRLHPFEHITRAVLGE